MKKYLLTILTMALGTVGVSATFTGDGYYRVQNYVTERYCYLADDKAYIDYTGTMVDLTAIELYSGDERMQSDPSTVLYFKAVNDVYDLQAQGTGVYQMINEYLHLRYNADSDTYFAYGVYKGISKYLGEDNWATDPGFVIDYATGDLRKWYVLPIDNATSNFFGLLPTVQAGGKNYCVSYCGFDYALGDGMTAYYVMKVDNRRGLAVYSPIANGKVAAGTPVFVECKGATAADNKVDVGTDGAISPENNALSGTYFSNTRYKHDNYVEYDPNTVRVLGTMADGSLGYVTADLDIVPHNTSYLVVPEGAKSEIKLVTEEEYAEILATEPDLLPQTITWVDDLGTVEVGTKIELTATASSGLDITYVVVKGDASIEGNILTVNAEGVVTVMAMQDGDDVYAPAEPMYASCNVYSGIKTVVASNVRVEHGSVINPNCEYIEVYNMQGLRIYKGCADELPLSHGLYVIATPQGSIKIAI